jgi:hypothetical protein
MCKSWRCGLFGLFVGLLTWALLSGSGAVFKLANAQEKLPQGVPLTPLPPSPSGRVDVGLPVPEIRTAPSAPAAPKGITELLADLSAIRAKKEELAKAEKDTLAAIRARLKQQKEELAQLEKKLTELGIETVEPKPPTEPSRPDAVEGARTQDARSGAPLLPLGEGKDRPR